MPPGLCSSWGRPDEPPHRQNDRLRLGRRSGPRGPIAVDVLAGMTPEKKRAYEAYWAAQTPREERVALDWIHSIEMRECIVMMVERYISDAPYAFWLGRDGAA